MSPTNKLQQARGSIMIAALIITLITGSLVGLFLKTVTQELHNSYRFSMGFQAINLAEAGLDMAIDAMIKETWSGTYWTAGANGYLGRNFSNISYSWRGERRYVEVYIEPDRIIEVEDAGGTREVRAPAAVAEGVIRLRNGMEVRRQVYIDMAPGRSPQPDHGGFWDNGILGRRGINLGGNKQTIDSFNTYPLDPLDPDNADDVADRIRYAGMTVEEIYAEQQKLTKLGHLFAYPNGTLASPSVVLTDISVGNADIYGRISTGSDEVSADLKKFIGPNGSLYDPDSPFRSKKDSVDFGNVAYDFTAELPDVEAPELDSPSEAISGFTIGSAESKTQYLMSSFDVGSNETYTVQGNVVMVVTGNVNIGGVVNIPEGSTLRIYIDGDLTIGGNGFANAGAPRNLLMYGTGTDQDWKLHGNGFLSAAVYAPNAAVSLRGGGNSGEMFGAIVGDTVTFSGNNYDFHYDESLAYHVPLDDDEDGGDFTPRITNWAELTAKSDRYDMASILTDGL
jgi:hypothetical protein